MLPQILRIAILPLGPFMINMTNDTTIKITGGYEAAFFDFLMKGLQMPYSLHLPQEYTWGAPKADGYWTGLTGMVKRNEVDIAISSIFISEERQSVVDFSYPYSWQYITFTTKKQALISKGAAFFQPFSLTLWIYVSVSFAIFLVFLRCYPPNKCTFQEDVLNACAIFLRQSECVKIQTVAGRMVLMSWMLFSFFISYSYTCLLLTFLTVPIREHGVRTINELTKAVTDGRYKVAVMKGSSIPGSLMNMTEKEKIIGSHILENKRLIDFQKVDALRYLQNGNRAIVSSRENMKLNLQDRVYISKDNFYSAPVGIAVNKEFSYKYRLDQLIIQLFSSGIYEKSFNDYVFRKNMMYSINHTVKEPERIKQLSIYDLYGILIVLSAGNTLAAFVCLAEILVFHCKKNIFMK